MRTCQQLFATPEKAAMASALLLLLSISSVFIPSHAYLSPPDAESFISILVSQTGLDFLKDFLVNEAVVSTIPLQLRSMEKSVKIPVVGNVDIVLSNITIYEIDVSRSYVKPGDTGVAIIASGTTCNMSLNWYYSYSTWLLPIKVSDKGVASVEVEGMDVGITLGLENQEGSLKLSLLECGCYVKDISIKLDGGASWLYQGMLDAFEGKIRAAVENAITKKMKEGVLKVDSLLQNTPKEIPVDDVGSFNVTFIGDPVLTASSIGFEINGLFIRKEKVQIPMPLQNNLQPLVSCGDASKMLGISLDEAVFNSASAIYFNAGFMKWIVDRIPDQSLLNTAGWRFIIPQLYKKYPNDPINLNISLTSPPFIRILEDDIDVTIYADLIIDVLESEEVIPVTCITLVVRGSGSIKVSRNNLSGSVRIRDFTMSQRWSEIGNLRIYLIQPVIWTMIQTVFLPYVNLRLGRGFPIPIVHGFTLQNAEIICRSSMLAICSDVALAESQYPKELMVPVQ